MNQSMPVLFVSHGSPMHAIQPSEAAIAWAQQAAQIPRPRAILMVSAHWESSLPLVGGAPLPQTIYDFGGFPDELYRIRYAAHGAPELAQRVLVLLQAAGFKGGVEGCRGLDHGAWVPLLKMYPQADVPVLQLSVQPELGATHHLALGRAIAALRDEGVLIIGSGHMTHNLRDFMMSWRGAKSDGYAMAFRDWIAGNLERGDTAALIDWEDKAPHARRAHPTPEHFMPLFVALGAGEESGVPHRFHDGFEQDVLSMDAWRWG